MSYAGIVDLEGTIPVPLLSVNSNKTPLNADSLPTYRIYGKNGFLVAGTTVFSDSGLVVDASNASPILITASGQHGLTTGSVVTLAGISGNTAANGTFIITKVSATQFSLDGTAGNGAYTSGGTWNVTGHYVTTITVAGVDGFEKSENYWVLFSFRQSAVNIAVLSTFTVT
jgi:hypothetical protein